MAGETKSQAPTMVLLHVEREGRGAPLLLISGLGGTADFWAPLRPLLRDNFQLVLFDHRGTGRSDRPSDGYSIQRIAADAIAIMDALAIERAHIVGHSTGGAVTQTLALDAADRLDRIVISASWARPTITSACCSTRLAVLQQAGATAYASLGQVLGYPRPGSPTMKPSETRDCALGTGTRITRRNGGGRACCSRTIVSQTCRASRRRHSFWAHR